MNRHKIFPRTWELKSVRLAFTLIELLIVVSIILVLVGISLKVMSLANRKTGAAQTIRTLEQVKNALAAYYSVYGVYPPVDGVYYEYEATSASSLPAIPPDMGYKTGLCYYIFYGPKHNEDAACNAWQHYLNNPSLKSPGGAVHSNKIGFAVVIWTNSSSTIKDAWGADIGYQCLSLDPTSSFQRYRLWSSGSGKTIEVTSDE